MTAVTYYNKICCTHTERRFSTPLLWSLLVHLALAGLLLYNWQEPAPPQEALVVEMGTMELPGPAASAPVGAPATAAQLPPQPLPVPIPQAALQQVMPPIPLLQQSYAPPQPHSHPGANASRGNGAGSESSASGRPAWHFGQLPFPEQQKRLRGGGALPYSSYSASK